jgi:hypothetical protein
MDVVSTTWSGDLMPASPTSTTLPIRVAFACDDRRSRALFEACLSDFAGRVEVLRRDGDEPDLLLVDPCADGATLDLTRFGEVAGRAPLVVYTPAPAVDELAFAMAGSVIDGRLRGWLSHGLPASVLVEALERIHRGDIVIADEPTSV